MSKLYTCYSVPLMKFLTEKKYIRYELVALNPTTQKKFWIFLRYDELHNALDEWKKIIIHFIEYIELEWMLNGIYR